MEHKIWQNAPCAQKISAVLEVSTDYLLTGEIIDKDLLILSNKLRKLLLHRFAVLKILLMNVIHYFIQMSKRHLGINPDAYQKCVATKHVSWWKIESEQQSGSPSILGSFSYPYQQQR